MFSRKIKVGEYGNEKDVIMTIVKKNVNQTKKYWKGKIPPQDGIKKDSKCFFCNKKFYMKEDFPKFKK